MSRVPYSIGYSSSSSSGGSLLAFPKNNDFDVFGDSITANCTDSTRGLKNYGYLYWAKFFSNQRFTFDIAHNFGVGGDTTTDMLARIGAVLASPAGNVILLGGTNDSSSSTATALGTIANLESMLVKLTGAGKFVYLVTPLPRGDATYTSKRLTTSQGQIYRHFAVCDWIRKQQGRPGVAVVDAWPTMAVAKSTNGDIIAGYTIDGLHPNTIGASVLGQAIATEINKRLPNYNRQSFNSSIDSYQGGANMYNPYGCFTANPMMEGTGGTLGSGGSLGGAGGGYTAGFATSWVGSNSSATNVTRTYYKDANDKQRCVIGGIAETTGPAVDICKQSSLHTLVTVGQKIEAFANIAIASSSNILSVQPGLQFTLADTSTVYSWDGDRYDTSSFYPSSAALSGDFRSPAFLVPAGLTGLFLRLAVYTAAGTVGTPTSVAADILISEFGARHVVSNTW